MISKQVRRTLQEYIASKKGNSVPIAALMESFNLTPEDIDQLIHESFDEENHQLIYYTEDGRHLIDSGKLKSWLKRNTI